MSYWRYWKLSTSPFNVDATQPLFRGETVEEALARIEFLVNNRRSVGALSGPSGVGKSALLQYCANNPPVSQEVPNLSTVRASMIGLREGELLSDLATKLCGVRCDCDSRVAWKSLRDYFQASAREGVQTVLLIDDTESATAAGEADLIRLLSMTFPLTIIFAVEGHLISAVSRTLIERCELQIDLAGWEISQTAEFLAWAIIRAGGSDPIFTDDAVVKIQQLSQGIARRTIQIADLSLVAAAVQRASVVDASCVEQVALELPYSKAA